MKYIAKRRQPHELIAWTRARSADAEDQPINWNYDDMPSNVRQAVKANLIREQGGICCYTGRAITAETSHIEHLKPQALCVEHEDTDYANLLAAYPSAGARKKCEYGAHAKENWYDQHLFVHPLRRDCETRLRYKANGKIAPASPADTGADETIRHLCLDHPELQRMRAQAIHAAVFEERLTKAQAQRLMAAMDSRDGNGRFRQFCFAIKQVCEKYLKQFD